LLRTYSRAEAGRMLESAAAIVCVSSSLAESTARRLPRRFADRIRVVRNGSDVHRFTPRERTAGPSSPSTPSTVRVVFIGRVIPDKGADVVLRAAALTTNRHLEFTVVGSSGFARDAPLSPYEQELRRLARAARSPVRFEPFVDRAELPELLRAADILVIPSRWPDPCPLTVGEGLAAGLPIIASRIGGIPEIVAPSTRLVTADDPAALAAELDSLAGDRPLRDTLARDARAWAETHDWPSAWRQLRDVLAGI
jgi:glycosyltransferase involved in cell wall biosynthesis